MIRPIFCMIMLLSNISISAYAANTPARLVDAPAFAFLKSSLAEIKPELDTDYCWLKGSGTSVPEEAGLVVVGIADCKPRYKEAETFYEVVYRGNSYYVKASDVTLKEEDLARLKNLTEQEGKVYKDIALYATKKNWLNEVEGAFNKLKSKSKYGIAILTASVYDVSEYTEGTGFRITFYNPTKKTIKYVTATFVGYNSVKDPVKDFRTQSTQLTLKGVGPIEPGMSATYSREYAWMTDLVETVKITGVKVQYMDGSTKVVKDPKQARLDRAAYAILEDYNNESHTSMDVAVPPAAPAAH